MQGMQTVKPEPPKLPKFSYGATGQSLGAVAISESFFRLTALESG